jgi:glyoxylase-like metal-dependent hydrolase (beta-lactamase superfamily II)
LAATWRRISSHTLARRFSERSTPVDAARFVPGTDALQEFRVCDYWDDGSLLLVDLPGHAAGQIGCLLRTKTQRLFYLADACWDLEMLQRGRNLPWPARRIQHSYPQYMQTQSRIRRLANQGAVRLLACHCPQSQAWFERHAD